MLNGALIERLRAARVVPVVRTRSADHAATAVEWLRDAGLRIFEITMTIPDAPALIRTLARDPNLMVGAGTVPDAAAARVCLEAGARFIVAPWIDATLAEPCRQAGAVLMLGAVTPTEVRHALAAGADVVKVFPAGSVGGPAHIRALASVLPNGPVLSDRRGGAWQRRRLPDRRCRIRRHGRSVGRREADCRRRPGRHPGRRAPNAGRSGAAQSGAAMSVDLLCMGEPMLEFNQLPAAPDGTQHYLEGLGGDTSNAAIAAARQGASVGYVTALGQDMPGDSFMRAWQQEGVDASAVLRTDRHQTGVYFVTHDKDGHHFLHYRANSAAAMYAASDLPEAAIASASILYMSGISQGISTTACDATFAAIEIARRNGVKLAYDTNYRPRLWPPARAAAVMHAAMAQAEYAMPGLEDVCTLTGLTDPEGHAGLLSAPRLPGGPAENGRVRRLPGDGGHAGPDPAASRRGG